jgi:hypothetical protein
MLPPTSHCRHHRSLCAAAVALCAAAVLRAAATAAAAATTFTRSKLSDSQWCEPNTSLLQMSEKSEKSKVFLFIDNALRTVRVFERLVWLGDRESHHRNQASQLTVSAIDNERTGVINNKQKTLP